MNKIEKTIESENSICLHRVDWRFLLPRLSFKRVLLINADREALLETAMQHIFPKTDIMHHFDRSTKNHHYDLVVYRSPTFQLHDIPLQGKGYLYWEIDRTATGKSKNQWLKKWRSLLKPVPLHTYRKILERNGLEILSAYWIWPNHATSRRMIRLDGKNVALSGQSFGSKGIKKLIPVILTIADKTGLLYRFLPATGLVAQKRTSR
ncbi:hypothetical protein GF407_14180 [candidate division KSB1 bacterium]|nr:hypothetical protein [candidate division KSB1 bacterium]